jgi:hypothetical protein
VIFGLILPCLWQRGSGGSFLGRRDREPRFPVQGSAPSQCSCRVWDAFARLHLTSGARSAMWAAASADVFRRHDFQFSLRGRIDQTQHFGPSLSPLCACYDRERRLPLHLHPPRYSLASARARIMSSLVPFAMLREKAEKVGCTGGREQCEGKAGRWRVRKRRT